VQKKIVVILQDDIPKFREDFYKKILCEDIFLSSRSNRYDFSSWEQSFYLKLFFGFHINVPRLSLLRKSRLVVLNGKYHNLGNIYVFFLSLFLGFKILYWGHYHSRALSGFRRKIKHIYFSIFDGYIFYTDDEVAEFHTVSSNSLLSNKATYSINNSCINGPFIKSRSLVDMNKFICIGRSTLKSNYNAFSDMLRSSDLLTLSLIGPRSSQDIVLEDDILDRISFFGEVRDEGQLIKIADNCSFFIYPGGIGLSILTAAALGLPIFLNRNLEHMPEVSYSKLFPFVIWYDNITDIPDLLASITPSEWQEMVSCALSCASNYTFDRMADSFINAVKY
jgi:glycosyltransferase involved in cell wall biosynthesis